ncbi:putative folate-biopterin transporter 9 chloroplastic [Bienertia sinuspersici]
MVALVISNAPVFNPLTKPIPTTKTSKRLPSFPSKTPINCIESQNSKFIIPSNVINKLSKPNSKNYLNSIVVAPKAAPFEEKKKGDELVAVEGGKKIVAGRGKTGNSKQKMLDLCGLGYWVQGFRCFPWLALNFHMAQNLNFNPSTLQLVQISGNLPMVAKPLYGILSDALYIGDAHRIPYVCIGDFVMGTLVFSSICG